MSIRDFQHKLRRSGEHLRAFDEAAKWWTEEHPYRISEEIDEKAGEKRIVVFAEGEPPDRLSLILGDAIHNLRSCLDCVVVELARTNSGGYLMPRIEEDLAFPITTSRSKFKSALRMGRLSCLPIRAQALIQGLQPYRRKDGIERDPLWVLHQLSNIDKHRRIPLLRSVVKSVMYERIAIGSVESLAVHVPTAFKDKAVLVTYSPRMPMWTWTWVP